MKLTKTEKQAKIKENQARIKEIKQQIKNTKKKIKELERAKAKEDKQRAKELKANKPNLTPEQKQILTLTEEMQILKFAVRTLILKDIETAKALQFYDKALNLLLDKIPDAKKRK